MELSGTCGKTAKWKLDETYSTMETTRKTKVVWDLHKIFQEKQFRISTKIIYGPKKNSIPKQNPFPTPIFPYRIGRNYGTHFHLPFFLLGRLDLQSYLKFRQQQLPLLFENVPLATRDVMFYMHDDAPAYFIVIVRNYLHIYPNRWIGHRFKNSHESLQTSIAEISPYEDILRRFCK